MGTRFDFDKQREQSAIKTEIALKYFKAWSGVMRKLEKIGYIDLFAGPGIYGDGNKSTPILILEYITQNESLRNKVLTAFNDKEESLIQKLKVNINDLEGINNLKYQPIILNEEVSMKTAEMFEQMSLIPCFSFIDPAGYKGLTLKLITALGKDFGSDLLFFFNYNDITRGVSNDLVEKHMESLFGTKHYHTLTEKLKNNNSTAFREAAIVNEMSEALKDGGLEYVLPFRFKMEQKERTSHYLIFASKHFLGFDIMKSIMSNAGEKDINGIGKFEFIPSCDKGFEQLSIIEMYNDTREDLKNQLIEKYKDETILFKKLYEEHSTTNRFLEKDYRNVLLDLENEKVIEVVITKGKRKKGTLPIDKSLLIFK